MTLYEELEWRGLIKDVAGEDIKDKLLVHKDSWSFAVVEEIIISFPASIASLKAFDKLYLHL